MESRNSASHPLERDDSILDEFNLESQRDVLFANTALFVLPSDLEGMPIVLLEALGYGTPVLARDIAPNREVLGSFGRTFKAGSVDDLKRVLQESLGKEGTLRSDAKEAQAVIKRDFNWPS
jgi:glycosyltransferase involved in cell wall biosynthesis